MYSYMREEKTTGNGNHHSINVTIIITNSTLKNNTTVLLVAILLHDYLRIKTVVLRQSIYTVMQPAQKTFLSNHPGNAK